MHFFTILTLLGIICSGQTLVFVKTFDKEESLTPYVHKHGSKFNHRSIRDCSHLQHGSGPHIYHRTHATEDVTFPFAKVKRFVKEIKSSYLPRTVRGHYVLINNPSQTLSVLEPDQPGGCALNIRQTVAETARKNNCLVAFNAGYFDTKQGSCLGNVISNGRRAHNSKGIQNAHFGLTGDGEIFTGYISEENYLKSDLKQLVGGVIWILRDGKEFVNSSKLIECEDTEETGPMETFLNIVSARTAIGHDKDGNVIVVQVDGKSYVDGANLYDMEALLKDFGLENAINLDGGGSATLVINGTTVNYPYDSCPEDQSFSCDRKVSTILCVHPPYCEPVNCSNHGSCLNGKCVCDKNWLPPNCDKLFCGTTNCSNQGVCVGEGCICHPGYFGIECNQSCPEGWYGSMCTKPCKCINSFGCDPQTGACKCKTGFMGDMCQQSCPVGYFGVNCQFKCHCNSSCCDPVTGACDSSYNSSLLSSNHAECITQYIIKTHHLVKDNPNEKWKWYVTMIILGVITSICLASCLLISCSSCSCYFKNEQVLCFKKSGKSRIRRQLPLPSGYLSDSSDSETLPMNDLNKA